jgi:F-type H+-transporting ATPase subunit b
MNINLTLIGQSITFAIFVWFCLKFVWPPIMNALHARKTAIADGLAAAEKGQHDLELAKEHVKQELKDAKAQAAEIIAQAHRHAAEIVDEAKTDAKAEGERIIISARAEIEQETNLAREQLRGQVVTLALSGAGKVLERELDDKAHADLLDDLAAQL